MVDADMVVGVVCKSLFFPCLGVALVLCDFALFGVFICVCKLILTVCIQNIQKLGVLIMLVYASNMHLLSEKRTQPVLIVKVLTYFYKRLSYLEW